MRLLLKKANFFPLSAQEFGEMDHKYQREDKSTNLYPTLAAAIIEAYAPPNATIIDPIAEHYTVLCGASVLGRKSIGITDRKIQRIYNFFRINSLTEPTLIEGDYAKELRKLAPITFAFSEMFDRAMSKMYTDYWGYLENIERLFLSMSQYMRDDSFFLIYGKNFIVNEELIPINHLLSIPAKRCGFKLSEDKVIQDNDFFSAGNREYCTLSVFRYDKNHRSVFNIGFLNAIDHRMTSNEYLDKNSGMRYVRIDMINKSFETYHLFSVVGINMGKNQRKLAYHITQKMKGVPEVVLRPIENIDGLMDKGHVKVLIRLKDKLYHLGWISAKVDRELSGDLPPKYFVYRWLTHDEISENSEKIIESMKLARIGSFENEEGTTMYYAEIMIRTKPVNIEDMVTNSKKQ